jgi:hypothetical protein
MRLIALNLDSLYKDANPLYIGDLKSYSAKNSKEHKPRIKEKASTMPSAKSLFIQCMWAWQKTDPEHIDLKSVTIDDMVTMSSPVCQVVKCVDEGYLKRVSGYTEYTHEINA